MSNRKKQILIIVSAIVGPILVVLLVLFLVLGRINRIKHQETALEDTTETEADYEEYKVDWGEKLGIDIQGNSLNILLIGTDNDENNTSRSDTMIVANINFETNKVTLISFLRDIFVQIPGHKDSRLNAAYQLGGVELLDETLHENFGINIDANVLVDFSAFEKVIDTIGGVEIYLFKDECKIINESCGTAYREGYRMLDGESALCYCRIRTIGTDFGRTERQRKTLTAIYNRFHEIGIKEALELIDEVFPLVQTDMTSFQIVDYAIKILPIIRSCDISPEHIPADGTWSNATIRGMEVLIIDFDKNRELIRSIVE